MKHGSVHDSNTDLQPINTRIRRPETPLGDRSGGRLRPARPHRPRSCRGGSRISTRSGAGLRGRATPIVLGRIARPPGPDPRDLHTRILGVRNVEIWRSPKKGLRILPTGHTFAFQTVALARRENGQLWHDRATHPAVSASGSRSPSPKTPRNRGNFRGDPHPDPKIRRPEDLVAVRVRRSERVRS